MKIRAHAYRFMRPALTGMISLGLTLALAAVIIQK
jgi:hypothetical protein